MKLSTKARYGSRAMLELALNYERGPVSVKHIALHQRISSKYLEHLIASLKAAGLVKSVRGARGGYILARPPEKIKLSEVFEVLEGSATPVECVDSPESCFMKDICATRDIWVQIGETMMEILEHTTLQDLAERRRQKRASPKSVMYYI